MSKKVVTFLGENFWNILNTLIAASALFISLSLIILDRPEFNYEILTKGFIENKANAANRLAFNIRFTNTGRRAISIKDIECILKVGDLKYECILLNRFVHAPANLPLRIEPGDNVTKSYYFAVLQEEGNITKKILELHPDLLLTIIDVNGDKHFYNEKKFSFLTFDEETLNELGKAMKGNGNK
jgi:hypothetical protein